MSNLKSRMDRLERAGAAGSRLFVLRGPDGFDASAALAEAGIRAASRDLVVAINKPVGTVPGPEILRGVR